jgi:O-antigen/teichoic acid export membrane protein
LISRVIPDLSEPTSGVPSLLARLYRGITRNVVAAVFNQGSTFALNIIAAHALGRLRFGEFMIVQATLTTVGNLGQFATGHTATKYVAEFRTREPARASRILRLCATVSTVTGSLAALALLASAPFLAARVFRAPSLSPSLMIAAPAALFIVMNGFRAGALGGLEAYGPLARVGVLSGTAYLLLGAAGAIVGGVNGALIGVAVSAFVQWVGLGRVLRHQTIQHGLHTVSDRPGREREMLLSFALPASISGFVTLPALWLASALLVRQPGGIEQMALFAAANTFRVLVLFLPYIINSVVLSVLNNQRGANDTAFRRVFWWNLAITVTLALAAALVAVVAGTRLLSAFGRTFDEGYPTLRVLMTAAVIEAATQALHQVVQSHARLWLSLFAVGLPRDVLIVTAAYVLTPAMGALGLATAYAIGWSAALCTTVALAYGLGIHAGLVEGRSTVPIGAVLPDPNRNGRLP